MFNLYRSISTGLKSFVEPKVFKRASERGRIFEKKPAEKTKKRIWFHASSVGELEMLIPVIEKRDEELVLTIFSESAEKSLQKLARQFEEKSAGQSEEAGQLKKKGKVIFAGYCPWEGEWKKALEVYRPDLFVSARYEAWPELWASLAEANVPLTIVGAQLRTSLKIAKSMVKWMRSELPRLQFLSIEDTEVGSLQKGFPSAKVLAAGDPRWDRVHERAKLGNARARELVEKFKDCPREWGVLGSVWMEDLSVLGKVPFELDGTIWMLPHQVDPDRVAAFEQWLKDRDIEFVKTSLLGGGATESSQSHNDSAESSKSRSSDSPRCILVDEMGFLSELYSNADWAYVGGGFGQGVHNTIEPGMQGIPVFCGPAKNHRFPEIQHMEDLGQLIVLKGDASKLRETISRGHYLSRKSIWRESAQRQLGAAERISKVLDETLGAC